MESTNLSPSALSFVALDGDSVGDSLLKDCAKLFSLNYGIWGDSAGSSLSGKRVKMSGQKLKEQCLSIPQSSVLATCSQDGKPLGHAFATTWAYSGGVVGWVTQLVVDSSVRRRYIATQLLQTLKRHRLFQSITAIGLASSHPAAVASLAKYRNVPIDMIDTKFIMENISDILKSSPINYVRDAQPHGTLFEENCTTGAISSLFTQFYVDHQEPLEVLDAFKKSGRWCLGELLEGHEFLIIVPV